MIQCAGMIHSTNVSNGKDHKNGATASQTRSLLLVKIASHLWDCALHRRRNPPHIGGCPADALGPVPPEVSEVAQRIADAALDAYTKEDCHYVLNALCSDRAATYISRRPPEGCPELFLLIKLLLIFSLVRATIRAGCWW